MLQPDVLAAGGGAVIGGRARVRGCEGPGGVASGARGAGVADTRSGAAARVSGEPGGIGQVRARRRAAARPPRSRPERLSPFGSVSEDWLLEVSDPGADAVLPTPDEVSEPDKELRGADLRRIRNQRR